MTTLARTRIDAFSRGLAGVIALALGTHAAAQVPAVVNPSLDTPRNTMGVNLYRIAGWNSFALSLVDSTRRRFANDTPPSPATVPAIIRSGVASGEMIPNNRNFVGLSTDFLDSGTGFFNDPIYSLGCGETQFCYWYAIPASHPLVIQQLGIKAEVRRFDNSNYDAFERFFFGPTSNNNTGHTNGQWQQACLRFTEADWNFIYNFYNTDFPGQPWDLDTTVNRITLIPFRFGELNGGNETGTVFIDDIEYYQDLTGAQTPEVELWDDTRVRVTTLNQAGVIEPGVPVFVTRLPYNPAPVRFGYGCVPRTGTFTAINVYDQVASTPLSFPQTWADLIANGYIRPTVQRADGTSGSFGTSLVSQPAFRPQGQPLDTVPDMTRADLVATFNVPDDRNLAMMMLGTPERADPLQVVSTGNYTGRANLVSTRTYPDPVNGLTQFTVEHTFTATQNITLQPGPSGRGNDAFRLVWFSSMLANLGTGTYDARFIAVESPSGQTRSLEFNDTPRGGHVFASPLPTAVGRTFTLYQDSRTTFNPGSPSIAITIDSITVGGAPVSGLGVQAYLDSSVNPNDDSLSVWLEWTGAPATIASGTVIISRFTVRATDPVVLGDTDADGDRDCADLSALVALCGQAEASATFNALADMNADGQINEADRTALAAFVGSCPGVPSCAPPACQGDANGDGVVNFADITSVLVNFNTAGPAGDANQNGAVNFADITSVLSNFNNTCA